MLQIEDFFAKLSNPLDDKAKIKKMISIYDGQRYYERLINAYAFTDKAVRVYNVSEGNYFYSRMFKLWKENLLSLKNEELDVLVKRKLDNDQIRILLDYVRGLPDLNTREQIREVFIGRNLSVQLRNILSKVDPFKFDDFSSWTYVTNRYTDLRLSRVFAIQHRLYLNISSVAIHQFVNIFLDKCNERGLAYEFKFSEFSDRDDSLVIYASTENLILFVNILEEIRKEHPEFDSEIFTPPLLTASYNGWIGYGAEPKEERTSYNSVRATGIQKVLDKRYADFISSMDGVLLGSGNKRVSFEYYVGSVIATKYLKDKNIPLEERKMIFKKIVDFVVANRDMIYSNKYAGNLSFKDSLGDHYYVNVYKIREVAIQLYKDAVLRDPKLIDDIRLDLINEFKGSTIDTERFHTNAGFTQGLDAYVQEKHKVVASKVVQNKTLYSKIFEILDKMYELKLADINADISDLIQEYLTYSNVLKLVSIGPFSFSSNDEEERNQYFIYEMKYALKNNYLSLYEHMRSLRINYDSYSKKL